LAQEDGMAVIPFNPLAGGWSSWQNTAWRYAEKGDSSEQWVWSDCDHARYWHEREFETSAVQQMRGAATDTHVHLVSIAWVLANPTITSAMPGRQCGSSTDDTLAAADYNLDSAGEGASGTKVSCEYRRGDAGK